MAALGCAALGASGVLGWLLDLPAVRRILPGLPDMQTNTALSLLACGLSLALPATRLVYAIAAFPVVIGALTMVEYGTGLELGVDDVFLRGTMRMAPQTSVALTLMGLASIQARVSDLLAYSRVGASVHMVPNVDLGAVLREVEDRMAESIRAAGATVLVGVLPTIEGDPALLRDLFTCLFDNALKFRRPGVAPVIRVASSPRSGGRVEITVEDNGVGLDPDDATHLFEVFRTVHRADYAGTGVGLAKCRRIVELHDGEISARGAPGVGAVFTVCLPVRAHSGVPPACVPADAQ